MRVVADIILDGLKLLDKRTKRFLVLYTLYLSSLSAVDGLALLLVAQLFDGGQHNNSIFRQVTVVSVVSLFLAKSMMAVAGTHLGLKKFAKIEVALGQRNLRNMLEEPWLFQRNTISSHYFNSVDRGPKELVIGSLLSVGTIVSEMASVAVIVIVIFIKQPLTSLITLSYFGLATLIQHLLLARGASDAGKVAIAQQNKTYQIMQDISNLSKLLKVQPSNTVESNLKREREKLAHARNLTWFYSALPRYVLEGVLAVGFVLVAFITHVVSGNESVFAAVAFFAIAGFRLLPSINRIQGMTLGIISTTDLVQYGLGITRSVQVKIPDSELIPLESHVLTKFDNVSFSFLDSATETIKGMSFSLIRGKRYAVVGQSGSGKSTLIDLILGMFEPSKGKINICRTDLTIGYVPQDTFLFFGTIAQNVSMEWDDSVIDVQKVSECLELVGLTDLYLWHDELVLDEDQVLNMSGGQKQRIGLARALYRKPNLLVLDEATSALDVSTELEIMEKIEHLHEKITVIMVAHRLSSLKNVDELLYLEDGVLLNLGSWDDLFVANPKFRKQVEINRK